MTRQIRFGDWCFDPETHRLDHGMEQHVLEPRVARLLEFLLEHPEEMLSHDRLVEAVWDGRVVSDEAVRRAVSTLRHALAADGCDQHIRTVHKKGYISSFPPPGESCTPDAGSTAPPPYSGARGPYVAIIALLVAMLTLALTQRSAAPPEPGPDIPPTQAGLAAARPTTIAVLPFVNLSEEADSEYFATGLSEELLAMLARHHELQVTARSSAFRFTGPQRDVRNVGQRLGVRYVVKGSVRKSGERVRIQAQLLDTGTGLQVWSDTYDRALEGLFTVQQEIAGQVARALELALVSAEAGLKQEIDSGAHLELLRARELLATWTVTDAEQAIAHLQRAITLYPGYAAAYALLADAIMIRAEASTGRDAERSTVAPLLDKALALDPALGEAYVMREWLLDDPVEAEREVRKGLELSPSYARGYQVLAERLAASPDRQAEALQAIDRALALNPLEPRNHHVKAMLLAGQGDFAAAEALEQHALALDRRFSSALFALASLSAAQGNFAQAVVYGERARATEPRADPLRDELTGLYLALGDIAGARRANSPETLRGRVLLSLSTAEWGKAAKQFRGLASPAAADLRLLSLALLREVQAGGDARQAIATLGAHLPRDGALPAEFDPEACFTYANLAQLRGASGDGAGATELRQALLARLPSLQAQLPGRTRTLAACQALLLAQQQDHDGALAALERAYAPAPLPAWWLHLEHPALDGLRHLPRFAALRARVAAHVAAERTKLARQLMDNRVDGIPNRLQNQL